MTEPPERYKSDADLSPAEHAARQQAHHRGKPEPKFETDEYRAARRKALEDAGLEPDRDPAVDLEDMSPEDHDDARRRERQ
jgi:hypothetical protein